MIRIQNRVVLIMACVVPAFCNAREKEPEKSELEIACELAVGQDDIEGLHALYEDAIHELPADEQYEMERQRGSLLSYAVYFGHEQVVRELLLRGFDVNKQSYYGSCALLYAIAKGYTNIAQVLLEAGADTESCNGYGESAVSIAQALPVKIIRERMLDVLRMYGATIVESNQLF